MDEIWEHKKGKVWLLVRSLELENRALRYQIKVLQQRKPPSRRLSHVPLSEKKSSR